MIVKSVKNLDESKAKLFHCPCFFDKRGAFSELFKHSDFNRFINPDLNNVFSIKQINESFSIENTFRGLHYQTNQPQGKIIRCLKGKIIDFFLDIDPNSENYANIFSIELSEQINNEYYECLWLPPGYAHGFLAIKNAIVQYLCTEEWDLQTSKEVSIFSDDISWKYINIKHYELLMNLYKNSELILSDKDKLAQLFKK